MKVFVTDGDNRAALAITRSLGAHGHQVIVGEKRSPSLAEVSRFAAGGLVYPDPVTESVRFIDFLSGAVRKNGIEVILPVADITTFLLTENREQFEPSCAVPFAGAEVVRRAANKIDIVQTAKSLAVPVPDSVIVCKADCLPPFDFGFPLVVKPARSRIRTNNGWVSTSVSFARDLEELTRDLESRGRHEFPLMLQECITGPGVGVFACYHDGRPSALFSHWRIRERPPWGGVSVLSQSTAIDPLAQEYALRLLDEIGWHGVAMVEFKRDVRDGVPKLMEINGRFWGSLQLAIDAGVDFPRLLVDGVRADRMPPPQPYKVGVRNRWLLGDLDALLLTLIGGHIAPKGHQPRRGQALVDFLKLGGGDLHYENPKWGDLRPGLLETRRWIGKALGGRREATPVAAVVDAQHGATLRKPERAPVVRAAGVAIDRLEARIEHTCLAPEGEAAWNALLPTSDTHSVFQTHEWNRSWWETFREPLEPCTVMVTGHEGLAGIAPLVIPKQSSYGRVVRFLGDGRSDYCDFLTGASREAALTAMLNAVFSGVDWDMIELNNLPSRSPTIPIVQSICERAGFKTLVSEQFLCRALVVEGREASARFILNKPSLRRSTNFFQRAGRLTCRGLTRADEIEPYLDRFFEQHVERWSGTQSPSLFLNQRNRTFYQTLTRNLSASGLLLFSVIELDGAPIAFHYGFDHDGVVIWYKPSFDIKHGAHSPGLVLMRHLIDYTVNGNKRELDFTLGDEAFKRRFANETRTTVGLRIFRRQSGYVLEQMRRTTVQAVKRAIGGGSAE